MTDATALFEAAKVKLALATAAVTHQILGARASLGVGSDAPAFAPLVFDACGRAEVRTVVADAGYDSEYNHRSARLDMGVRSMMPPRIGRPSSSPPSGHHRRLMKRRFKSGADAEIYGQRSQSETTNSMMKRNLGDSLRSIRPLGRSGNRCCGRRPTTSCSGQQSPRFLDEP